MVAYACIVGTSSTGLGQASGCVSTAGAIFKTYGSKVAVSPDGIANSRKAASLTRVSFIAVSRRVDIDDLVDAHGVAEIIGVAHRNTVSEYLTKYDDMPRPVINLGRGRPMLWLRPEIERWASKRVARGQTRSARRPR